jgi:hypothetical protein
MRFLIFVLLGILCCQAQPIYGQVKDSSRSEFVTSCEENEAKLDQISKLVADDTDVESFLVVIAHAGSGELSTDLISNRLYNATEYVLVRSPSIRRQRIITARGEKTSGLGRVDFYFNGKIVEQLFAKKNRTLCVDCCENDPIPPYTPYKPNSWKNRL